MSFKLSKGVFVDNVSRIRSICFLCKAVAFSYKIYSHHEISGLLMSSVMECL